MSSEKFIQNKLALTTLICACVVVLMSLSVRQVFGMFFIDFNNDLGISNTEFGLAIGIQMLGWGLSGPIFGVLADKYGGHKSIILAFLFYILGVYFLYAGPNTGIYFKRVDLSSNNIVFPNFSNVSNTDLNTTISNEFGVKVSTIEHLMGALFGLGIDNALIEIDNDEVPILDGSAKEFIDEIIKSNYLLLLYIILIRRLIFRKNY